MTWFASVSQQLHRPITSLLGQLRFLVEHADCGTAVIRMAFLLPRDLLLFFPCINTCDKRILRGEKWRMLQASVTQLTRLLGFIPLFQRILVSVLVVAPENACCSTCVTRMPMISKSVPHRLNSVFVFSLPVPAELVERCFGVCVTARMPWGSLCLGFLFPCAIQWTALASVCENKSAGSFPVLAVQDRNVVLCRFPRTSALSQLLRVAWLTTRLFFSSLGIELSTEWVESFVACH
mmetsp:Transcript_10478/g.28669  ORF Transcript_10478/g.28669 Transcript_10478/m.28669 type:complete len:236 (+) Transcript_10478:845-1552(+)|eukprot:scaffold194036_cov15-Tisochrysis_lutea.AAC.3